MKHSAVKKLAKETPDPTLLLRMHAIEKGSPLWRWKFLMRSKEAFPNGCQAAVDCQEASQLLKKQVNCSMNAPSWKVVPYVVVPSWKAPQNTTEPP
mmetsp:Transcript_17261/g.45206  ORF Transcript_17261/g.45206 Transcript_17261/m.45206 type:complete len:96 (+) Transcript_17261:465-752(+)